MRREENCGYKDFQLLIWEEPYWIPFKEKDKGDQHGKESAYLQGQVKRFLRHHHGWNDNADS